MADEQQVPTIQPAPVVAPVVDAPVTAPVETSVSTPTVTEPAAATAAPAEASAGAAIENVLGDSAVKPAEAKPAEAAKPEAAAAVKPETETPAAEAVKPEGEAAVLPVYEPFKLPEGINLDKEPLDAFTKVLGEIETGKLDHAGMQEAGQKLVDLATKATADSITRLNDYYVEIHEKQKKDWFEAFKKDPEMGGEQLEATVGALRDAVETYGGSEAQISEFRAVMKETGVGNHPAVIRILNNMAKTIAKFTTEGDTAGAQRMVPGQRPAPSKVKDYQRFYAGGNS